jgi:glycosyltransferase involved in cell wall biosynthesis
LRILVVHNRYQQPGGEDRVVEAESCLLATMGHDIEQWEENNDSIASPLSAVLTALQSVYSFEQARAMRQRLQHFQPDVVHIHNFFPRLSPSIHMECHRAHVPVVQTLHNFRLLCPAAILHAAEGRCSGCAQRIVPWPAVVRGCYRQNRLASLAVANMLATHRLLGTWNRCVRRFIALSENARQTFVAAGLPAEKIMLKPNFVDPDPGMGTGDGNFALFVGRLVEEKGVATLLAAWQQLATPLPLKIIGDGPLAASVVQAAAIHPNIESLGMRDRSYVQQTMAHATILILPSTWDEAFPVVIAEAFAAGLPIVASRLGAMAELIEDGQTGRLFVPGDATQLARTIESVVARPRELQAMRLRARAQYEQKYTAAANYPQLLAIYKAARSSATAPALQSRLEAIG